MKVQKSRLNTRSSVKISPMVESNHPMIPFQWLMQPLLKVENNLLIKKKKGGFKREGSGIGEADPNKALCTTVLLF